MGVDVGGGVEPAGKPEIHEKETLSSMKALWLGAAVVDRGTGEGERGEEGVGEGGAVGGAEEESILEAEATRRCVVERVFSAGAIVSTRVLTCSKRGLFFVPSSPGSITVSQIAELERSIGG